MLLAIFKFFYISKDPKLKNLYHKWWSPGARNVAMVKNIIQQKYEVFSLMWFPLSFLGHWHWITHALSYPSVFVYFQKTQHWRICAKNSEAQGQGCVAMVKNISYNSNMKFWVWCGSPWLSNVIAIRLRMFSAIHQYFYIFKLFIEEFVP